MHPSLPSPLLASCLTSCLVAAQYAPFATAASRPVSQPAAVSAAAAAAVPAALATTGDVSAAQFVGVTAEEHTAALRRLYTDVNPEKLAQVGRHHNAVSCHVMYRVMCDVMSCHVMSCHVIWCITQSCRCRAVVVAAVRDCTSSTSLMYHPMIDMDVINHPTGAVAMQVDAAFARYGPSVWEELAKRYPAVDMAKVRLDLDRTSSCV